MQQLKTLNPASSLFIPASANNSTIPSSNLKIRSKDTMAHIGDLQGGEMYSGLLGCNAKIRENYVSVKSGLSNIIVNPICFIS